MGNMQQLIYLLVELASPPERTEISCVVFRRMQKAESKTNTPIFENVIVII